MFKRRIGDVVYARSYWTQGEELLLKSITFNLMLISVLLGFIQSIPDPFSVPIATASEPEWDQARELRRRYPGEVTMTEALWIVEVHFASPSSLGMIRMRESGYYRDSLQTTEFLGALHELFDLG